MADMTIHAAHAEHDDAAQNENRKFAMWLYLTSEVVIFSMLIAGYAVFRANHSSAVNLVKDSLGIWLVTGNTFVLLASSYAMVMGLRAIRMGSRQGFYGWIALTALLGTLFLAGQYVEYGELGHLGISLDKQDFTVATNIFENVNHVEATLDNGETIDLREEAVPEGNAITSYHVDFEDNAELFANVNIVDTAISANTLFVPNDKNFVMLDENGAPVTDADAIEAQQLAINDAVRGLGFRRDGLVPLSRVAVETTSGEVVPFSAVLAGQAVDIAPAQYNNLNAYFRGVIGESASDYGMRFYAPTAFHGAHVAIGVLWALLVLWRGRKGFYDKNAIGVEMFGLYWHFVDVVWIVLFTLIYLI